MASPQVSPVGGTRTRELPERVEQPKLEADAPVDPRDRTEARIEKLTKISHAVDPVGGWVSGPIRIYLGTKQLVGLDKETDKHHVAKGVHNISTGLLSTMYGTLQALWGLTSFSGLVGLAPLAAVGASGAAALGGYMVMGYTGGGAAVLKGGVDLYKGIKDHQPAKVVGGSIKLASAGLMAAGAMTMNPALVVAGGAIYIVGSLSSNKEQIVGAVKKLGAKLRDTLVAVFAPEAGAKKEAQEEDCRPASPPTS